MTTPDTRPPLSADERADRYLHSNLPAGMVRSCAPMTGDASDRRYYRVHLEDGTTQVLAVYALAFDPAALPFLQVARVLSDIPVAIPRVIGVSGSLGVVAQSDEGDQTLQAEVTHASRDRRLSLYAAAVDLIGALQVGGRRVSSEASLPFTLAFDVDKLTWELDFFVTHFLGAFRAITLSSDERAALAHEWKWIARALSSEPRVLCHRDYHSRNLMVTDDRLVMVDFQDARLGPNTYDLVSLLRDSYVQLTSDEVERHLRHFADAHAHEPLETFRQRFRLMAVQRNLKALGTFGYQATSRRNPAYAQYVPRTLAYVRQHFAEDTRFARLATVLSSHLAELR